MSVRILLVIIWGFFSSNTFAQSSPVDNGIETGGYSSFPVLQCPATNEAMKDFRKKLLDLKKAIKEEANCKGIEADVAGLTTLVTKERDTIMQLITKGQSQGLTKDEQGKVEQYVQQVTEKTSNLVSVLTGNDACFDEDKKGMSLEFITSLIGEGSKILSVVGGPQVGATVQVAGEVITGFLKAMKTIQENRQGYKFKDTEQRMAYANSLCSLFDYRRELNKLIDPYDSVSRLVELENVLKKQVEVLRQNCIECREIIAIVEQSAISAREGKAPEEVTIDDIWAKAFENSVISKAKEIDKLYTRRLGTHTYRSLKTLSWIPLRIRALEDRNLKADLGLEDVLSEMASIEKFMVTEQAGEFLKQLIRESQEWQNKIVNHIIGARYTVSYLKRTYPHITFPEMSYWASPEESYGQILESLDVAREDVSQADRAFIRTYFKDLESLARSMNIATEVATNYCTFFENADWYRSSIRNQCGGKALEAIRMASASFLNYHSLMPSNSEADLSDMPAMAAPVLAADQEVAQDWVESLTRVVDDMTRSSDYVTRQTSTDGGAIIQPLPPVNNDAIIGPN